MEVDALSVSTWSFEDLCMSSLKCPEEVEVARSMIRLGPPLLQEFPLIYRRSLNRPPSVCKPCADIPLVEDFRSLRLLGSIVGRR